MHQARDLPAFWKRARLSSATFAQTSRVDEVIKSDTSTQFRSSAMSKHNTPGVDAWAADCRSQFHALFKQLDPSQ